jgi:hypothetical protein
MCAMCESNRNHRYNTHLYIGDFVPMLTVYQNNQPHRHQRYCTDANVLIAELVVNRCKPIQFASGSLSASTIGTSDAIFTFLQCDTWHMSHSCCSAAMRQAASYLCTDGVNVIAIRYPSTERNWRRCIADIPAADKDRTLLRLLCACQA